MPRRVPAVSPVTGEPVGSDWLHASDAYFRDTSGRAVLLRGINLSDASKAPVGQTTFDSPESIWSKAEAGGDSFVGRPLQLDDGSADVHLARLRAWGFNCLRYVFTWEAIEHAGPGQYDEAFLDYTVEVLRKVKQHGFRVFMDPHQDLFSRFTGGSGAPYWVLPACGIDHRHITATQAAFLQYEYPTPDEPDPQSFPAMIWATNYTRLAAATLGVFFFAGRDFAPKCAMVDDLGIGGSSSSKGKEINIQDYLQSHFIESCRQLALRIRDAGDLCESCVIGWDSMNEPNGAYVGLEDLTVLPDKWPLKKGPMPTPLQSMRLGMGMRQTGVQNWIFGGLGPKRQKDIEIDPGGKSLWLQPSEEQNRGGGRWGWKRGADWPMGSCPWAAHGVWDVDSGNICKADYFKYYLGNGDETQRSKDVRPVEFVKDYWLPFWRSYHKAIRSVHCEAIMFIQPPVFEPPPELDEEEDLHHRACTSQHFYDGLTLITKHWNWFNADAVGLLRGKYPSTLFAIKVGLRAIRQGMRDQLGYLRNDTLTVLGKYPTLIGEIGVPFDMDDRRTYYGDSRGNGIGDYREQVTALDASLNACDGTNLLSFTAWTYNPDNSHKLGDGWNGEDFSIWSRDDIKYAMRESDEGDEDESGPQLRVPSSAPAAKLLDVARLVSSSPSTMTPTDLASTPASTRPSSGRATPAAASQSSGSVLDAIAKESSTQHVPAITNGSRCSQAYCRPYPRATLGTPVEMNFDIKTSAFNLTIEVDAEDLAVDPHTRDPPPPTEIFVPFLHYAADSLAGAASGNVSDAGRYSPYRSTSKDPAVKEARTRTSSLRNEIKRSASRSENSSRRGSGAALDGLTPMLQTTTTGANDDLSASTPGLSTTASTASSSSASSGPSSLKRTISSQSGLAPYLSPISANASSDSLSLRSPTSTASTKSKLRSNSALPGASDEQSNSADGDGGGGGDDELFKLAIEYTVTAGRVEIVPGQQLLKWYLTPPKAGSSAAETALSAVVQRQQTQSQGFAAEPPEQAQPGRHKITFKRLGGPIAFKQSASAFEVLVEQMQQGLGLA